MGAILNHETIRRDRPIPNPPLSHEEYSPLMRKWVEECCQDHWSDRPDLDELVRRLEKAVAVLNKSAEFDDPVPRQEPKPIPENLVWGGDDGGDDFESVPSPTRRPAFQKVDSTSLPAVEHMVIDSDHKQRAKTGKKRGRSNDDEEEEIEAEQEARRKLQRLATAALPDAIDIKVWFDDVPTTATHSHILRQVPRRITLLELATRVADIDDGENDAGNFGGTPRAPWNMELEIEGQPKTNWQQSLRILDLKPCTAIHVRQIGWVEPSTRPLSTALPKSFAQILVGYKSFKKPRIANWQVLSLSTTLQDFMVALAVKFSKPDDLDLSCIHVNRRHRLLSMGMSLAENYAVNGCVMDFEEVQGLFTAWVALIPKLGPKSFIPFRGRFRHTPIEWSQQLLKQKSLQWAGCKVVLINGNVPRHKRTMRYNEAKDGCEITVAEIAPNPPPPPPLPHLQPAGAQLARIEVQINYRTQARICFTEFERGVPTTIRLGEFVEYCVKTHCRGWQGWKIESVNQGAVRDLNGSLADNGLCDNKSTLTVIEVKAANQDPVAPKMGTAGQPPPPAKGRGVGLDPRRDNFAPNFGRAIAGAQPYSRAPANPLPPRRSQGSESETEI
jgi:hypothetical protein